MAPRANGGYRTYVLVEYPVSLVYKNYLEEVNKGRFTIFIEMPT